MPSDDLSSIPELQDKHHRVLAEQLKITTFRALVHADRRDVHRAMRYLRPRPTLEQIATWQDHARSRLSEAAAADRSDWHPAASFAVVFAQCQVDGGWQRRLEVERTEVEPEQVGKTWPGWDCREICGWMLEQLGGDAAAQAPATAGRPGAPEADVTEAGPGAPAAGAGRAGERARLRISNVAVIGPAARVRVPGADAPAEAPPDLPGPVRVEITIRGAGRGQEIHAMARVLRAGEAGWNPHDLVVKKGAGLASLDLSGLPPGQHDVTLLAWAPDGGAEPAVMRLPVLTIRPGAEPPSGP